MFKIIRVFILLAILFVVASNTLLDHSRATDWEQPLYISIYPMIAGNNVQTAAFIKQLKPRTFAPVETFFIRELKRYGKNRSRPVIVSLLPMVNTQPPVLEARPGRLSVAIWSLKMRYWAWRATSSVDGVPGDINVFVSYHPAKGNALIERSTALRKGQIGLVNARASRASNSKNNIVITHEVLHVLGATDKYNLATGQPLIPEGLAEPERQPLYPQRGAEIMAARIALSAREWRDPANIGQTLVGAQTAYEIGFVDD